MTYWLINLPFLALALVVLVAALSAKKAPATLAWLVAAGAMVVLTAVFDNAIIGSGLVAYNEDLLSGFYLGVAPLEDFAYTAAALVIIPALWHLFSRGQKAS